MVEGIHPWPGGRWALWTHGVGVVDVISIPPHEIRGAGH